VKPGPWDVKQNYVVAKSDTIIFKIDLGIVIFAFKYWLLCDFEHNILELLLDRISSS